jgi:pyrimidine-specific ribonucleoside hydrolase
MGIPLIHITDLYHPPQDPDDHFDLATVYALPEFDLKGVVLDATRKFLDPAPTGYDIARDPGFIPVMQLNYLTGRSVPVACGPLDPLVDEYDAITDRPRREQAGVEMLLDILASSGEKITITVVGSLRVVAAAFNRAPDLVMNRTNAVVLNAGSVSDHKEWNVKLDPEAYKRIWRSGLPIHWYPCASDTGGFDLIHPHATYWYAFHDELLPALPTALQAWFAHGFTGDTRGDILHILTEQSRGALWELVLSAKRNLWSTASLIMTAGRCLAETNAGWRFLPRTESENCRTLDLRLVPIAADVNDDTRVVWEETDRSDLQSIFRREGGDPYRDAMAEALRSLLSSFSIV